MKLSNTLLIALLDACSLSLNSQTALPYFTGFDNVAQQQAWTQYRKGVITQFDWDFGTVKHYSGSACLIHDYPLAETVPTDDWFVSPVFNFSSGATIDSVRHSFWGWGAPATGDTIAMYLLKGSPDPALAASKTMLVDFRGSNYKQDSAWRKTLNINIPATSGACYIAFRYITVSNWLDVKFDNLRIKSKSTVGLQETKDAHSLCNVYPNPVANRLTISPPAHDVLLYIGMFDREGRLVKEITDMDKSSIDVSELKGGLYFLRARFRDSGMQQFKFYKE